MKVAIILIFALACLFIFFLFFNNKSNSPPPRRKNSSPRPHDFFAPTLKEDIRQPLNIHDNPIDRIAQLKVHVMDGINNILSSYQPEDTKSPLPYQRQEINPEIVAKVKSYVGNMKVFSSFDELSRLLDDANVDMSRIAKKISTDPVLSNKILKVANSAYFGSAVAVDSINHALAMLGLINIKAILFHNAFSNKFSGDKVRNDPVCQSLWGHAISTATCAFHLSEAFDGLNRGKLYTLGLVHDIGKFIVTEMNGNTQVDKTFMIPYGEKSSINREDLTFGINHAVIGRIAFEDSGLSEQLLRLIEYHHFPSFASSTFYVKKEEDKRYIAALYLANQIAKLFAGDEEKHLFSIQPIPPTLGNLVNRYRLENIFCDNRVLSEIAKTKSLTASYIQN